MTKVHLSKSDLPKIIANIEANGGDASELRAILEDNPKTNHPEEMSDDEVVNYNRSISTIQEGDGLVCSMCNESSPRLTSGTCDQCFRSWSLSCKAAIVKMRRKDGSSNHG